MRPSPPALVLFLLCVSSPACRKEAPTAPDAGSSSLLADASAPVAPATLVRDDCLGCHTEQMLEQQRLTPKQWASVVKKMIGWGAPVEPDTVDALVAYLASRYPPDAGPYDPPSLPAAQAAATVEPLGDGPFAGGDPAHGAALYRDRCAACHGQDGQGQLGVALVDRPLLFRAPDFAAIVRRGKGRMPPMAAELHERDIADLLADLRTIRP